MKTLALVLLLAAPSFSSSPVLPPAPSSGTVESSKLRLEAQDPAGALADAQAALAKGGGAEAYAALADAKLAVGRPLDEVIADYKIAATLDPRYFDKYQGLVTQKRSEENPALGGNGGRRMGLGANGLASVLGAAAVGIVIFIAAVVLLRGRERPVAPAGGEPPKREAPREDV